jgi:uncharacterized protein YdhG (YjbR/CyaY superfamily)
MNSSANKYKNVNEYIKVSPKPLQQTLKKIRDIIRTSAPDATESIAYGMPAYKLNEKPLVYFAYFEKHIGFYATPSAHKAFSKELAKYKQGKGSVQFPLDKPIPYTLIAKMVKFNVKEK